MDATFEIFIDQLVTDEDERYSFHRNAQKTLGIADEWALPLSDTEICTLIELEPSLWDRVAEELIDRLQQAA